MLLGIEQGGCIDDVKLDVVASELEISADEFTELLHILFAFQQSGYKTDIEQSSATLGLIQFTERLDYRSRSVTVATVSGRCTVGDGEMGETAVGRSPTHLSEIVVAGR